MTNIRKYVEAMDLRDGETKRINCPACGGTNTFTAYNDMGSIVYNCYKLGCTAKGVYSGKLTALEIKARMQKHNQSKPKDEVQTMTIPEYVVIPDERNELLQSFISKWGLHSHRILYDVKDRRAVFPIYYKGRIVDAVGRALDGKQPKWLRYTGNAVTYQHCNGTPNGTCVLVEDVISAIAVGSLFTGTTGVAILGTSLGPAHMEQLDGFRKVIVALDPDAYSKTIKFKHEVEAWLGVPTKALLVNDDIKYKQEADIDKLKRMIHE